MLLILVAKSIFFSPLTLTLSPLGGEGIKGRNFWQTLEYWVAGQGRTLRKYPFPWFEAGPGLRQLSDT